MKSLQLIDISADKNISINIIELSAVVKIPFKGSVWEILKLHILRLDCFLP